MSLGIKKILSMKYLFHLSILVFGLSACTEEPVEVKVSQVIEEVETEVLEENPSIETITDIDQVNELRESIRIKREADERALLDSMTFAERLVRNDSLVYDTIVSLLLNADYTTRSQLIRDILNNKPSKFKLSHKGVQSALLVQLNDTIIERQAMKAIGNLGFSYSNAYEKKFLADVCKHRSKYFYWIGREGKSKPTLDYIQNLLKKNKLPKDQVEDVIYGLEQFTNSSNKEISSQALSVMMLVFKKKLIGAKEITTLKKKEGRSDAARSFVKTILKHGDNNSKAVLNICLKNNLFVKEVFKNLVRNKNPRTKSRFLKQISSKRSFVQSIPAAPVVYKYQKDSTIAIQILKALEKQKDYSPERIEIVKNAFNRMNAMPIYKNADQYLKNKDLIKKLKIVRRQPVVETDYDEMALNIYKNGLTDSLPPSVIETIKSEGMYADENALLKNILSYQSRLLTVEKLAPSTPIDYEELFFSFKKAFPNHLAGIEFVSEFENNDYSWLIVGPSIGLIAHPRNNEDSYDLELFLSAMNEIKASTKRFQVLSQDVDAQDVFLGNNADTEKAKNLLVKAINP